MRMNRQDKGTQAETLDFHPEVQQPKHHTMINHHQQTSQTNFDTHVSNSQYYNNRDTRTGRNRLATGQDYYNSGNRGHQHYNRNRWQSNEGPQQWTSTPRDYKEYQTGNIHSDRRNNYSNFTTGDTSFNNSLLNLLDSQQKVQQDTTQVLEKMISLWDMRANDMF